MSHSHGGSVSIPAAAQYVTAFSSAWGGLCGGCAPRHVMDCMSEPHCHPPKCDVQFQCLGPPPGLSIHQSNSEQCRAMRSDDQNRGDLTYYAHFVLLDVLVTMCASGCFSVSFWGPASAIRCFLNVLAEQTICSMSSLLSCFVTAQRRCSLPPPQQPGSVRWPIGKRPAPSDANR